MSDIIDATGNTQSESGKPIESGMEEILAKARINSAQLDQLLLAAEAAKNAAQENLTKSAAILAQIENQQKDLAALATQSLAAKTQITDEQAVIATKSDHIQKAQEHADKIRGDLDRTLTAATAQLTDMEANKARAKTAADLALELQAAIAASKTASDADITFVKKNSAESLVDFNRIKKLADKADSIEERIAHYEARLTEFDTAASSQLATILGLLPGATSAGLASAFDTRRTTFLEPGKRWQAIFVGSIIVLVLLAGSGLIQVYLSGTVLSYGDLFRVWLSRLPIAASLIWLALHASRESSLAKRLEEDYGYKSAISASFQGFQQQMKEIGAAVAPNSPLGKLCEDTLATLASPPGRIYEKHSLIVSPSTEIATIVKTTVDAVLAKNKDI